MKLLILSLCLLSQFNMICQIDRVEFNYAIGHSFRILETNSSYMTVNSSNPFDAEQSVELKNRIGLPI